MPKRRNLILKFVNLVFFFLISFLFVDEARAVVVDEPTDKIFVQMNLPAFHNLKEVFIVKEKIYDSLGGEHELQCVFKRKGTYEKNPYDWGMTVSVTNGSVIYPVEEIKISFYSSGSFRSMNDIETGKIELSFDFSMVGADAHQNIMLTLGKPRAVFWASFGGRNFEYKCYKSKPAGLPL